MHVEGQAFGDRQWFRSASDWQRHRYLSKQTSERIAIKAIKQKANLDSDSAAFTGASAQMSKRCQMAPVHLSTNPQSTLQLLRNQRCSERDAESSFGRAGMLPRRNRTVFCAAALLPPPVIGGARGVCLCGSSGSSLSRIVYLEARGKLRALA